MSSTLPPWCIGPFSRPVDRPIIMPTSEFVFNCPMKKQTVRWAENHTFNPAAIARGNTIHMLFRAEDGVGDRIREYTSRIGHALSTDGISFALQPEPVIYPSDDAWVGEEWRGGCEDPRVIETENGDYVIYYTMWNLNNPKGCPPKAIIGVATSTDLVVWQKHGPAFEDARVSQTYHKAAGVVQRIHEGRLVAAKIQDKYWMYWGEDAVRLASSTDLVNWTPVLDEGGEVAKLITPRSGYFDSEFTEVGPPPILTDNGIVLVYNGKNSDKGGDSAIGPGAYAAGQLLFDPEHPATLLDRLDKPFLEPELDFEKTGQYPQGTVFVEGLVLFKSKWYLYYGTADTYVGVATAPFKSLA